MDTKLAAGGFAGNSRNRPYPIGGMEELAHRIIIRLTVPRGAFSPDPDLGSRLGELPRGTQEEMTQWARYAVEEALSGMPEVTLESLSCAYDPQKDRAEVVCGFRVLGEALELALSV